MSRRTVWAVSTGSYSSYSVVALFEDKADAEALAATYTGYDGGEVEEFELYSPGDRSRRNGPVWIAEVCVNADATLSDRGAELHEHYAVDDDGPVAEPASVEKRRYHYGETWDGGYRVIGRGLTEEQAVKGAKDKAAEVAALILDGVDPREILHGRVTKEGLDRAWEEAEREWEIVEKARAEQEARQTEATRQEAIRRTRVALFDGDKRVTGWCPISGRTLPVPANLVTDLPRLKLRTESGIDFALAPQVARVLGAEDTVALVWDHVTVSPA